MDSDFEDDTILATDVKIDDLDVICVRKGIQKVPFPLNPTLHEHEYEPALFKHVEFPSHEC